MANKHLRQVVTEMSDKEVRRALFSLATQLDDGEFPSVWNLLALIIPDYVDAVMQG
jgi:hypothetical protein